MAFLYIYLKKKFTRCPKGMSDVGKDDCIILNKCIYGLVQAVRQYYKKDIKNLVFLGGNVDPCLYTKKSAKDTVYKALYVDDNIMICVIEAIDGAISALKENGLGLMIMEGMQDYLSCEIKFSMNKKRAWLGQPHLIKTLDKKFGKCVKDVCNHITQGVPKFLIVRPTVERRRFLQKISGNTGWV